MASNDTAAGEFRTTLWTVVLTAKDASSAERREALETLIARYWKPLYAFIRRRGSDPEAGKDITQGFFTALIEKNYLQSVDRDKGRFRTFLLAAFRHYAADEFDRGAALKRGGGRAAVAMDFEQAEAEGLLDVNATESPDQIYLREWALQVLAQALGALKAEYASTGRGPEFEALQGHLGQNSAEASYADLARRLGCSESDVRNRLHRARVHLREAILRVIRSYSATEESAQDELRDLFSAFMS
jgi:RNA polymerase sigma factor (sigma-70 family)